MRAGQPHDRLPVDRVKQRPVQYGPAELCTTSWNQKAAECKCDCCGRKCWVLGLWTQSAASAAQSPARRPGAGHGPDAAQPGGTEHPLIVSSTAPHESRSFSKYPVELGGSSSRVFNQCVHERPQRCRIQHIVRHDVGKLAPTRPVCASRQRKGRQRRFVLRQQVVDDYWVEYEVGKRKREIALAKHLEPLLPIRW